MGVNRPWTKQNNGELEKMVYDPKEFHLLHELTKHGEEVWRWMLEKEADRILFKNWCLKHPMKALWWLVKKAFGGKDVD